MAPVHKIILLLLTLAAGANALQAQHIPGFLGKRFFVEAQASPTIYYRAITLDNSLVNGPRNPMTLAPKLSLNYVTKRHNYISLEAEQHQFIHEVDNTSNLPGADQVRMRTTIRRTGLGFYRTFRKKTGIKILAPLGRYFGYRLYYAQIKSQPSSFTTDNLSTVGEVSDFYDTNFENPEADFLGMSFVLGNRTMLSKRVTFSFGVDLGLHFLYNPEYFAEPDKRRLLNDSDFNGYPGTTISLQMGLGLMLF